VHFLRRYGGAFQDSLLILIVPFRVPSRRTFPRFFLIESPRILIRLAFMNKTVRDAIGYYRSVQDS
jgi:hypothetical protein